MVRIFAEIVGLFVAVFRFIKHFVEFVVMMSTTHH